MAPEEVALEHSEIDNVTGFSVEFERVDDGESPKRHNFELECENGGERDRSEEATVDGTESEAEISAQDWSSLDREMQHEPSEIKCSGSRGQNGTRRSARRP